MHGCDGEYLSCLAASETRRRRDMQADVLRQRGLQPYLNVCMTEAKLKGPRTYIDQPD